MRRFSLLILLYLTIIHAVDSRGQDNLQSYTVSGIVTDETGIPLPGVNITVNGTFSGVITGLNGEFYSA